MFLAIVGVVSYFAARFVFWLFGKPATPAIGGWSVAIALAIPVVLIARARIADAVDERRRKRAAPVIPVIPVIVRETNGIAIVAVSGRTLDFDNSKLLDSHLTALLNDGRKQAILDLSKVGFMYAPGVGALVKALLEAQKAGAEIKLVASSEVHETLRETGIASKCDIYSEEDSAVSAFAANSAASTR